MNLLLFYAAVASAVFLQGCFARSFSDQAPYISRAGAPEESKLAKRGDVRPVCEDNNVKCASWSEKGYCKAAADWMKKNCPKACNECEEEPTTEQPTEQQTTEAAPETTEEATQAPTEQTTPAVTRPECKDKSDNCEKWSNQGQCSLAEKWMTDNCPKSCGFCKACALKTRHGHCCVFPFIFEDKEYTSCTKDDIGESWCSLTKNYDVNGQWDYCEGLGPSCMKAFNLYRTAYNIPKLEWDDKIAADAQKRAQFLDSTDQLVHEVGIELGETLYKEEYPESETTCKKAADKWFEQITEYERLGFCDSPPSQAPSSVSDFVQLMWKGTTKFGVGIAGQYLVARYSPKGNVAGKVADNVLCDAE